MRTWQTAAAARAAAVAILLAVTAAGLQARGTFSHAPDTAAAGATGVTLAIILTAAEGLALVAFLIVLVSARPARQPDQSEESELIRLRIPWWAKTIGVLLALAALVTPLAVLVTRKPAGAAPRPLPGAISPGITTGHHQTTGAAPVWPVIAGMAVAIAVVVALTIWTRRGPRSARRRPPPRTRLTQLLDSLAAGRDALTAIGEPRQAIIACYAAMERGFAAAGRQTAPAAADTPAEVLTRATAAGLVSPEPAAALTSLFRRARYSSQPMTGDDSRAAARALDRMRADLHTIPDGPQ